MLRFYMPLSAVPYCTQISKLLGAKVVAVTSGADKVSYLKQIGADAVVDTAAPAAAGQRLHKLIAAAAPKGGYACHVL
jgi:NADPH-dependent curcumin reductase CurA